MSIDVPDIAGKVVTGNIAGAIVDLLKGVGLLKDPAEEAKAKQLAADIEVRLNDSMVDFVRATTPPAERVYVWVNSLIAIVRPAISLLIVFTMVVAPQRILLLVEQFGKAGPSGWIVLAPVLWWFFGRDVSKLLALRYGGAIDVGSGAAEPAAPAPRPPMRPIRDDR